MPTQYIKTGISEISACNDNRSKDYHFFKVSSQQKQQLNKLNKLYDLSEKAYGEDILRSIGIYQIENNV